MNEPETFRILTDNEPNTGLFQQLFAIDVRSLAVLRVFLGAIVFFQVLGQFSFIPALYSDHGVLSQALNRELLGEGYWSVYWIGDTAGFAQTLLVITAAAACGLMLGFHARFMCLTCLVLIWSLQVRNPLVLTGGDVLLRMLLFWSVFLPISSVWSLDARRTDLPPEEWQIVSWATAGIMLQVAYMYFFSGLAKLNSSWLGGGAIEQALQLEMSVKPIGLWLASMPWLLWLMTYLTLAFELFALPLMFIPRIDHFTRGIFFGFFVLLHVGIGLAMSIGIFSITAIVSWVIFIPADIWDEFSGEAISNTRLSKSFGPSIGRRVGNNICFVVLIYITIQHFVFALGPETAERFSSLQQIGRATMTIQKFQMFARPPQYSPWFSYQARLENGEQVDLFFPEHNDPGKKPDSVYRYMQNQNWRRVHWNLIEPNQHRPGAKSIHQRIRRRLLGRVIDNWDKQSPDNKVISARLICHFEPINVLKEVEMADDANTTSTETWAVFSGE